MKHGVQAEKHLLQRRSTPPRLLASTLPTPCAIRVHYSGILTQKKTFSYSTLNHFKKGFELFDRDKDGYISQKEVPMLMRHLGYHPTEEELHHVRNIAGKMIVTKNNKVVSMNLVNLEKFCDMMAIYEKENDAEQKFRKALELFDREGNGFISSADLRVVLTFPGEHCSTDAEVDCILKKTQGDVYDYICYEDLIDMMGVVEIDESSTT